ncbi:MAG: GerAB/ArcD/ProY family transporter [Acutalibacteraceae bacterium]|nr:GerAB/ArcD/ProY family transporter [Acutalibacteraceae bacterium]
MDNVKSNLPYVAITGLFIIGNSIINLPLSKYPQGVVIGFLLSVILGLVFIIIALKKSDRIFSSKLSISVLVTYSLFCALVTVRNFITFSDRVLLTEAKTIIPSLLFITLLYIFCRANKNVILKISTVSFAVITITSLLFFILNLPNISFNYLIKINEIDLKGVIYEALAFLLLSFIQSIILIYFLKNNIKKHSVLTGYFYAVLILSICLIQTIGIFGTALTGQLLNPYASSVSIISLGDKFLRLEGFSYFLYFAATLIKSAVCLAVGKDAIGKIKEEAEKYFLPVACSILSVFCVFTNVFKNVEFMYIIPLLLIPPVVLILKK